MFRVLDAKSPHRNPQSRIDEDNGRKGLCYAIT